MSTQRGALARTAAQIAPPSLGVLMELGQEAERQGRHAEARAAYERAIYTADAADGGAVLSDLARWIGRTYIVEGDLAAASDATEAALAIAEAMGDRRCIAAALNAMGAVHQTAGDLDHASFCYKRAEVQAKQAGDVMLAAMIQHNLAIIANIQGEFELALAHYRDCIAGFRAIQLDEHVVFVLNNMGMLFTDLSRWRDAEEAFTSALDLCDRHGNLTCKAMVLVNQAELLVASDRSEEAERACESAAELVVRTGDERVRGELAKMLGVVLRERGALGEAEEQFHTAASIAEERGDLLLAAEVLREQAALYSQQERHRERLLCLNRSHGYFGRLRARRDIADLDSKIRQLEDTFLAIVRRWGESIESADRYTQGHCMRVADHACALARAVGMDEGTLFWFRMGALLHDVGKIVVPAEVLNKAGGFTPEERQLMERHPDAGVALLSGIEFPWDIRPMVRYHHERWSGGGYPTGISGEDIPLAARILCIADVFDALSTDRPYRRALPMERCLDIMANSMHGHFDPKLLDTFIELCYSGTVVPPAASAPEDAEPEGAEDEPLEVLLLSDHFSAWEMEMLAPAWTGGVRFTIVHPLQSAAGLLEPHRFAAVLLLLDCRRTEPIASIARTRELLPELPILVMTEQDDEELALRVIQHGAQEVLARRMAEPGMLERHVRRSVERSKLERELQSQSLRDDLTGLYNRRGFLSVAGRRMRAIGRQELRPILLYVDLDGLKQINDNGGHSEGDRALMEVAGVLRSAFRETDVVARLGGDEFVVLTFQPTGLSPRRLVRRIQDEITGRNPSLGRGFALSVSIGVACGAPGGEQVIGELLEIADQEMYRVKRRRNAAVLDARLPGVA